MFYSDLIDISKLIPSSVCLFHLYSTHLIASIVL